ncbi:MAG: hypothetical protein FWE09_06770, partial [Treponema sp.]|nr:hypothetical protein [Treponema sp.]
ELVTLYVSSEEDSIFDRPVIFRTYGLTAPERNRLKEQLESEESGFARELYDGNVYRLDFRDIKVFELSNKIKEGFDNLVGFINGVDKEDGHIVYVNANDMLANGINNRTFNDIIGRAHGQFGGHNGGVPSPDLSQKWMEPPQQLHERDENIQG